MTAYDAAPDLHLRPVIVADLDAIFVHHADPEAAAMAGVTPRDREQFDQHWAKLLADPALVTRAIEVDGAVVGDIGSWQQDGQRLVGYSIGRDWWGRGIATRALRLLLEEVTARPLHAHVAVHNAGSVRVLEKCGFRREVEGTEEHEYVLD